MVLKVRRSRSRIQSLVILRQSWLGNDSETELYNWLHSALQNVQFEERGKNAVAVTEEIHLEDWSQSIIIVLLDILFFSFKSKMKKKPKLWPRVSRYNGLLIRCSHKRFELVVIEKTVLHTNHSRPSCFHSVLSSYFYQNWRFSEHKYTSWFHFHTSVAFILQQVCKAAKKIQPMAFHSVDCSLFRRLNFHQPTALSLFIIASILIFFRVYLMYFKHALA